MIYSSEAMPLFEEFQVGVNEHAIVIREFNEFVKSGNRDSRIAEDFLKRMETTAAKQAELLQRLQPFRLDV